MTAFLADRWAGAFVGVCAEDAEEGLALLKLMAHCLEPVAYMAGTQDACQAEKILRRALAQCGAGGFSQRGAETALGTLLLLIRRGYFHYHARLIEEIARILDRKNGVVCAELETFAPSEESFREQVKRSLLEKTHAREVKIEEKIAPELLGGYRIRVGTAVIDASLRSLLHSLAQSVVQN